MLSHSGCGCIIHESKDTDEEPMNCVQQRPSSPVTVRATCHLPLLLSQNILGSDTQPTSEGKEEHKSVASFHFFSPLFCVLSSPPPSLWVTVTRESGQGQRVQAWILGQGPLYPPSLFLPSPSSLLSAPLYRLQKPNKLTRS